jgi:hypothetical protein
MVIEGVCASGPGTKSGLQAIRASGLPISRQCGTPQPVVLVDRHRVAVGVLQQDFGRGRCRQGRRGLIFTEFDVAIASAANNATISGAVSSFRATRNSP